MTDSRDGWLDDLAEASARITQLEATIENLSFQANSLIKRGSSLASENAALREDKARLDWVEEKRSHIVAGVDSFWNVMTSNNGFDAETVRAAIDAARKGGVE